MARYDAIPSKQGWMMSEGQRQQARTRFLAAEGRIAQTLASREVMKERVRNVYLIYLGRAGTMTFLPSFLILARVAVTNSDAAVLGISAALTRV